MHNRSEIFSACFLTLFVQLKRKLQMHFSVTNGTSHRQSACLPVSEVTAKPRRNERGAGPAYSAPHVLRRGVGCGLAPVDSAAPQPLAPSPSAMGENQPGKSAKTGGLR